VGYAFINFVDTKFIRDFFSEFDGRKWEKFNSEKVYFYLRRNKNDLCFAF